MQLVSEGYGNHQIALRLGLSYRAVKHLVGRIFLEEGVGNRTELAVKFVRSMVLLLLLAPMGVRAQQTTVNFDNPAPAGSSGALMPASFGGINWTGWRWESSWNVLTTKHVYFDSATGPSRSFTFAVPQVLVSFQTGGDVAGTLTVTDDQGQSVTQAVTVNRLFTVTTGWTKASTRVTFTYTAGWALGFDNIVYATAVAPPPPPPPPPPPVAAPTVSFTAIPDRIPQGEWARLFWVVDGSTDVSLSPIGNTLGSGLVPMDDTTVAPAATTTYTLTAVGDGGTTVKTVTVNVVPLDAPPAPEPTVAVSPAVRMAWLTEPARWPACDPVISVCLKAINALREEADGSFSLVFSLTRDTPNALILPTAVPAAEKIYRLQLVFLGTQGETSLLIGALRFTVP